MLASASTASKARTAPTAPAGDSQKCESKQKLDDDEFVSVHRIPIKELFSLIKSGKIIDPKTLCALSMMLQKNDLNFKT